MAIVHRAELRPAKLDLLAAWLPSRPWYRGPAEADVERVASYRFDDPAGEVGIETILLRAGGGPLLQAPLTYRAAPLAGADRWLVGTADHSVLGRRWVYDGCGDPVYAGTLARTILTGAGEAEEFVELGGRLERRRSGTSVRGSGLAGADVPSSTAVVQVDDGDPTLILTDSVELAVVRVPDVPGGGDGGAGTTGRLTLSGTWSGQSAPLLLAHARTL